MAAQNKLETMYRMRQSGTTLERVGSRFGITREGVRQLLTDHYGSTRIQNLLTATELVRRTGCGYSYVSKLKRRGIIRPAMVIGHGRTLWNRESVVAVIEYIDRHRCPVCDAPVPSDRLVYCSRQCYLEARRYKNQPEEAKRRHNRRVKRWMAQHPERAKQIEQRKQRRQQAKRSLQRHQTAEYVIWRKCPIPLGTLVRVLDYNRAGGRVKVEWGEQVLDVPFGCVLRIVKEAVATKY